MIQLFLLGLDTNQTPCHLLYKWWQIDKLRATFHQWEQTPLDTGEHVHLTKDVLASCESIEWQVLGPWTIVMLSISSSSTSKQHLTYQHVNILSSWHITMWSSEQTKSDMKWNKFRTAFSSARLIS